MPWRGRLGTYSFVASTGRLKGRPGFLQLEGRCRNPFVAGIGSGISDDLADQGSADGVRFRHLGERQASLPIPQDSGSIDVEWAAADVPSFELRSAHAGTDAFDDQASFQFGDRADDDNDRPPEWKPAVSICSRKLTNAMLRWLSSSITSR